MKNTISHLGEKLAEVEHRVDEIEKLNQFLARQAKTYHLLFDTVRRLNVSRDMKTLLSTLDSILLDSFEVDEYALIVDNPVSEFLTIIHSGGLPRRELKEMLYKYNTGIVGKVFTSRNAVYIPDAKILKGYTYFNLQKNIQGSLYYLPVQNHAGACTGVIKMRKYSKDGFSEVQRSIFPQLQKEIGISLNNARQYEAILSKNQTDEATGLFNQNYFQRQFQVEFKRAQRYQHELSLILISIKGIKIEPHSTDSSYFLKNVGEILINNLRSSDICVLYDRDLFALLLPETPWHAVRSVAVKLKSKIDELKSGANDEIGRNAFKTAIGIASYPQNTIEPKMLIEIAKEALHLSEKSHDEKIVSSDELGE